MPHAPRDGYQNESITYGTVERFWRAHWNTHSVDSIEIKRRILSQKQSRRERKVHDGSLKRSIAIVSYSL